MSAQLAIDVGATGIKGALVDVETGILLTERIKLATPKPATPQKVADTIHELIQKFEWKKGKIGIGFPAVVKDNLCFSASNIDKSWINIDIQKLIKETTGFDCLTINDADAAGLAEIAFGKGKNVGGTVILLTLGSGIGSGIFKDGQLLLNTELGRMIYKDSVAEHYASNNARKSKELSWEEYALELNDFLLYVKNIFSPDLIIIGGGISKKFEKYSSYLDPSLNITPANFENNAGIIGAAIHVSKSKTNAS